ncbi:hypothetical protein HYQ44_006393 [Verticillium longisporum]|nr:hypothetical protein HYQ44_006393 [Verticillium longisporum]
MTKCTILQNTATHSPPPCPAFAAHVLAPPCRAAAAGRLPRTISTAPRNENRYGSEYPRCLKTALWAPSQAVTAPPVPDLHGGSYLTATPNIVENLMPRWSRADMEVRGAT